jgi:hypothetical protein
MDIDHDSLTSRWQATEARLNQIAAAPGLDRELCRSEVERLLAEQAGRFHVAEIVGDGVIARR